MEKRSLKQPRFGAFWMQKHFVPQKLLQKYRIFSFKYEGVQRAFKTIIFNTFAL